MRTISSKEINQISGSNPAVLGFLAGYVAEHALNWGLPALYSSFSNWVGSQSMPSMTPEEASNVMRDFVYTGPY